MDKKIFPRITINPQVCNGKPTIRGMRFTVLQLLELLASGMTTQEILSDYEYLEKEDILAALQFASKVLSIKSFSVHENTDNSLFA